MYFFYSVCFKPHVNLTVINENIKEIHILVVGGGILEFPFLSHMLLCREINANKFNKTKTEEIGINTKTRHSLLTCALFSRKSQLL